MKKLLSVLFLGLLWGVFASPQLWSADFKVTAEETSKLIEKVMREQQIPGLSIALVHNGKVVWKEGFGFADKENNIIATPSTIYRLGSISKTITAVLALILHEEGRIDIAQPFKAYYPDFNMLKRFSGSGRYEGLVDDITVERLLNHHSGIPGDILPQGMSNTPNPDFGQNQERELQRHYLSLPPGAMSVYSNAAFTLAGDVIEQVSGMSFTEFARKRIFNPLKMISTSYLTPESYMARGYIDGEPAEFYYLNLYATGALNTTVEDMAKFMKMLLAEGRYGRKRILRARTVRDILPRSEKGALDFSNVFVPGLGLDSVVDPSMSYAGRAWLKDGSTGDSSTLMKLLPDKNMGVIVMLNSDSMDKYKIATYCLQQALLELEELQPTLPTDSLDIAGCVVDPAEIEGTWVCNHGVLDILSDGEAGLEVTAKSIGDSATFRLERQQAGESFVVVMESDEVEKVFGDLSEWRFFFKKFNVAAEEYFGLISVSPAGSKDEEFIVGRHMRKWFANKVAVSPLTPVWKERIDKSYVPLDIFWDTNFSPLGNKVEAFTLTYENGMLNCGGATGGMLLVVHDDNTAFIANADGRGDSGVRFVEAEGQEHCLTGGYEFICTEDILPLVGTSFDLKRPDSSEYVDWYRFTGVEGEEYSLSTVTEKVRFLLVDEDSEIIAEGNEQERIDWVCGEGGVYYVMVMAVK